MLLFVCFLIPCYRTQTFPSSLRADFLNLGTIGILHQISLCYWGGWTVRYKVFSSNPSLCLLSASSTLPQVGVYTSFLGVRDIVESG